MASRNITCGMMSPRMLTYTGNAQRVVICFMCMSIMNTEHLHDDVIEWKHFPRNWLFVQGMHRSPVNFPHKRQ